MRIRNLIVFLSVLVLASCASIPQWGNTGADDQPIVIMIGIDGLRPAAIDEYEAPALRAIASEGVRADYMLPVMPSLTFVNFYSLATGLYADKTGITSNMPYSKAFGEAMDRDMHGESRWWGGEPIWVTAEKQGVISAAMFWLGSEAEIMGTRPTHWSAYEHNKPHKERVEKVLNWLALPPAERPGLITLYFSVVDSAGHRYGPNSIEEGNALKDVDNQIADLRAGIAALSLTDQVNLIVVSDHGMTEVAPENKIYLDDYIDFDDVFIPAFENDIGAAMEPFLHIIDEDGNADKVYRQLKGMHPKMQVYKYENLPEDWHLQNPDRTGDLFVTADAGWVLFGRSLQSRYPNPAKGMHGYDRFHPDMRASFFAVGPNFQSGITAKPFENVEVYGLIAEILGIEPAPNDGNIEKMRYMLQTRP